MATGAGPAATRRAGESGRIHFAINGLDLYLLTLAYSIYHGFSLDWPVRTARSAATQVYGHLSCIGRPSQAKAADPNRKMEQSKAFQLIPLPYRLTCCRCAKEWNTGGPWAGGAAPDCHALLPLLAATPLGRTAAAEPAMEDPARAPGPAVGPFCVVVPLAGPICTSRAVQKYEREDGPGLLLMWTFAM